MVLLLCDVVANGETLDFGVPFDIDMREYLPNYFRRTNLNTYY